MKNYIEGTHTDSRYMRSRLKLKSSEFDSFCATDEVSITFCLRELRALLSLADSLQLNISMEFDKAGKLVPTHIYVNGKKFTVYCLIFDLLGPLYLRLKKCKCSTQNFLCQRSSQTLSLNAPRRVPASLFKQKTAHHRTSGRRIPQNLR